MAFTAEHISKYKMKLESRINSFSGKFMSDAKWLKLFKALSINHSLAQNCIINSIWDDVNELLIPAIDEFSGVFNEKGIKDVMMGGPCTFKEIGFIEIPAYWKSRGVVEAHKQDLTAIKEVIDATGKYEIDIDKNKLIVYGYR